MRDAVHIDALQICTFDQIQSLWSCGLARLLVTHMPRRLPVYKTRPSCQLQCHKHWAMAARVLGYEYCSICQSEGLFICPLRVSENV